MKWIYPLRGMNTNGKVVGFSVFSEEDTAYVYNEQDGNNARGFSNIDLDPTAAATPTFLICTTNYLELNGLRNVDLRF